MYGCCALAKNKPNIQKPIPIALETNAGSLTERCRAVIELHLITLLGDFEGEESCLEGKVLPRGLLGRGPRRFFTHL